MKLPEELHRMTTEALAAVQADPTCRLAPSRRLAIYRFLGQPGSTPDPVGRRARGWLGWLTARRVLPVWHELRPVWWGSADHYPEDSQLPDRLLSTARSILRGACTLERAWHEANDLWFMMESMHGGALTRRPELPNKAYYARDACLKALHETFCIEFLQRAPELVWSSDEFLQDWERDTAACAVLAEAGGADAGLLDQPRRLVFWQWWLTDALPTAWTYAQETQTPRIASIHMN